MQKNTIRDNDQKAASDVIKKKAAIAGLAEEMVTHKSQRLGVTAPAVSC